MDLRTGINRFCKAKLIYSIVQQYRVLFITVNKQAGCGTYNKIPVSNLLFEHRTREIGVLQVRIKMIPAQIGKAIYIFRGDNSFLRYQLIPDLQFLKILFKRMFSRILSFGILLVHVCDRRYHGWRALDSYPLHIMLYSSNTSHFFTAAGTTWTTMNQ